MKKWFALGGSVILILAVALFALRPNRTETTVIESPEPEITAPAPTPEVTPSPTPEPILEKEPEPSANLWDTTMENWGTPTPAPAPSGTTDPVESQTPTPIELFESIIATKYTNTAANIRESYTTTSAKIATLPINTEIKVIGIGLEGTEASGWSKIEFNETEVYVSSSLLSDFKIEIQQPVQTQKPQQPSKPQQPQVQQPSQIPQSSEDEFAAARAAAGFVPSKGGTTTPQGPVVVTNTELILPD